MTTRGPRFLPMVSTLRSGKIGDAGSSGGEARAPEPGHHLGLEPDPARIQAGWQHRFVAEGQRAEEMITLYRELGFDVEADPVRTRHDTDECSVCLGHTGESYRAIYTRQSTVDPNVAPET